MEDLITWLRAQWDADERVARGLAGATRVLGKVPDFYSAGGPAAEAYWDHFTPARALAEVDAKRRILDLHAPVNGYDPNGPVCSTCGEQGNPGDESAVVRWPCPTVRLLALPMAGRDGYRENWRP